MKKIFLEMYLRKNLGDDLFLRAISRRYDDVKFYTIAGNDYISNLGLKNVCGRSFLRRAIDKLKRKVFGESASGGKRYAAKVVLGGSMFIEQRQNKVELKKSLREKYGDDESPLFVLGANFGPYRNKFYYDEYKKLFVGAKDVCFRDKYSANLFNDLRNVRMASDIIFGLDVESYSVKQEKKVVVSVINLEKREKLQKYLETYEDKIVEISDKYAKCGYEVVLMSFCEYEGDEEAIERILKKVSNDKIRSYYYRGNIGEALNQIASSEIVIGTRFHAVVLGLTFNKKTLPIIYSDKTRNMLEDIGFAGRFVEINEMSSIDFKDINSGLVRYGGIKKLRKDSERHFEKLDEYLNRD